MDQEMATTNNHPQDLEEEELLHLQETAAIKSSSPFLNKTAAAAPAANCFSHLHLSNRPPCTSCGSAPSFSFGSQKKSNTTTTTTHSIFGLSKSPLSSPPSLRRSSSDPYNPPLPAMEEEEEPPLSPQPNVPGTPLSNAIASNKLPPRHPTLKRSVSDPIPSPAKTFSSSFKSPHAEWLRKMRDCMREMSQKWDKLCEEDTVNEDINNNNNNNNNSNDENKESNTTDATMDMFNEGCVEAVSVEKKGEALILHFKCPCGNGYQILLLGGNCYYKLM